MAPDFEYFARGKLLGTFGHTWLGVLLWGVPITLIVAAIYHYSIKWIFLLTSPRWLASRAVSLLARPWRPVWTAGTVLLLALSAALGNATHIVWDGFTHASGWLVGAYPILESEILVLGGSVHLYQLLQHGSSLLGLVAVLVSIECLLRHQPKAEVPAVNCRWIFLALVVVSGLMMNARLHAIGVAGFGHTVVATIGGGFAGCFMAACMLRSRVNRLKQTMQRR